MKTLIINGSSQENRNTAALLNTLKSTLKGQISEIAVFRDNIFPCLDCPYCLAKGKCFQRDKMDLIYADDFDNVVIAASVRHSGLPGLVMNLAERLQVYYWTKPELKPKTGGLILVGGGHGRAKRALSQAEKAILRDLNATLDPENIICSLNTNELPTSKDEDAIQKVKQLAMRLNGYGRM